MHFRNKDAGMSDFNDHIFKELLFDPQFVRWARGEVTERPARWEEWKICHPDKNNEFDEAVSIARGLSFSSPSISDQEIDYLWHKTLIRKKQAGKPVRKITVITVLMRVAAALFLPLMIYTGMIYSNKQQLETSYSQLAENQAEQTISVVAPIGTRTVVNLPDGSTVWLNSGSRLVYPALFSRDEREVRLEGEAYFDIRKDEKPFIVENFGPTVKVYGTRFNVNAYADEKQITVALEEGRISLDINGDERFLLPGQVSFFYRGENQLKVENQNIEQFVCWREGKLIFRNTTLDAITRVLQRQYHVDFKFEKSALADYKYNATFQNESLEQILQLLELSAPLKFQYTRGNLNSNGLYQKGTVKIYNN